MNLKLTQLQLHVLKSIQAGWKLYLTHYSFRGTFYDINRIFTLKKGFDEYPIHKATGNSLYDRGLVRGTKNLVLTKMGKLALSKVQEGKRRNKK